MGSAATCASSRPEYPLHGVAFANVEEAELWSHAISQRFARWARNVKDKGTAALEPLQSPGRSGEAVGWTYTREPRNVEQQGMGQVAAESCDRLLTSSAALERISVNMRLLGPHQSIPRMSDLDLSLALMVSLLFFVSLFLVLE